MASHKGQTIYVAPCNITVYYCVPYDSYINMYTKWVVVIVTALADSSL